MIQRWAWATGQKGEMIRTSNGFSKEALTL
jgi:hypothetical protein